jgi:hypothetical protein
MKSLLTYGKKFINKIMPTYDFLNTETGEEFEKFMSLSEREQYLKDNPKIQQVHLGAMSIVSGVSITGKVPDGFKEVLSKVAENHKTSAVAERHGRKSMKEIKTQQLVHKHIGKF